MSTLRDRLLAACDANGVTQKPLTVLAEHRDPYRLDTPAMHRAGKWLAEEVRRLRVRTPVHLPGLFYALVAAGDVRKPDGGPFVNTNDDWVWLSEKVAKAARWLGYVDWTAIKDERNEPLEIYVPEPKRWSPNALISFDLRLELPSPDKFEPLVYVDGFAVRQPYRLVLLGEKASLGAVLRPIAERYGAMLVLPSGFSNTLIYEIANSSAKDGRPTVCFYFADCDPAGFQMSISVARKLQAFNDLAFPSLDIQVQQVALTVQQVKEYGLPSTPLRDTERRADRWKAAFGVEQTEIDALAALRTDLLRRLAVETIRPFFNEQLDRRVREVKEHYHLLAIRALAERADRKTDAELRARAEEFTAGVREKVEALGIADSDEPPALDLPA